MLGLGASGSLSWILKPGMSMYLGLGTSICWLLFLSSVFKAWDGFRNGKFKVGATVICILGFFGTVGCMIYGGNIAEVRGPLIYAIWAILSCLAVTLVTLVVKMIAHVISNGRTKGEESVDIISDSRQLIQDSRYEKEKLETNLRESGKLGTQMRRTNAFGYDTQQQQNPYATQQNPYMNQPTPQNPYGNQPTPQNPYGNQPRQQQNPYGNQQRPQQQNPYGNQPRPQQNPYGNQQRPQQNPYGNQPRQQQSYRMPQRPKSPYEQQHYGTGSIDLTGHSKKSGFIGK